jgi:hypothetical protein
MVGVLVQQLKISLEMPNLIKLTHSAEIPETPEPTIAILILLKSNLFYNDNAIPIIITIMGSSI